MSNEFTQPKVWYYLRWLGEKDRFGSKGQAYDEKSNKLLDEFFRLMEQVSPIAENGARTLWLRAPRGPISDFGDPKEVVEDGEFESEEDFISEWEWRFPDETEWYEMSSIELKDEGYRAVMLRHRFVIVQDSRRPVDAFPNEIPEFVQWLVDSVKECIEMLRAGTYNDFVRENLPPQHRTGKIRRSDFWSVWPENRTEFFEDISEEDVAEFIRLASIQTEKHHDLKDRLPQMTANDFYRFCAMGYAACNYKGCDKTPKEQYYLNADGRDDGLKDLPSNDPEAFHAWLHDKERRGGHPWEVCRGGNSTHVSLMVVDDENGYWLYLAGNNRTIETIHFYLALSKARIPVYLREAPVFVKRLQGDEMIGIVPEGVTPKYCESHFPDEHIIDYMNLPDEDREQFLPFCIWYDEPQITLLEEGGAET